MIIGIVGFLIYMHLTKPKTAYVNTIELYNDFLLKEELEENMIATQKARERILDSLKLDLQSMATRLEAQDVREQEEINHWEFLRKQYLLKKDHFEEDNIAMGEKYTDQIWKQLNQYIKDYGTTNGYEYIFGADGQGKLMHATESNNITSEVLVYINERYQGASVK